MQTQQHIYSIHSRPDLRGLLLVFLTGSWIAGILVNAWLLLSLPVLLCIGALALLILCWCWSQSLPRLGGLLLLFLCLGAWRYTTVTPISDPGAVGAFIGTARLQVQGEISTDPRLETNSTLLLVDARLISLNSGQSWQTTHGQIQVQVPGAVFDDPYAPHYGDTLQLAGQLTAPPGYATPALQASMIFPRMTIKSHGGNPLLAFGYQVRTILAGIFLKALPQPFAALLIAIFLSLRTPPLKPLLPLFNVTGVAHLIAPSGFKVTLLAGVISAATRWLIPRQKPAEPKPLPAERRKGNWRRWLHTLLLVLCIACYTMLSGAGPAALRAGAMGGLLIVAPRLGRFYNVYTAMALTVLVMSMFDPFVLWDSGFQLSFIGTLGILLLTPFFQRLLRFLERLPLGTHLAEIIAVTLAAQVATLPLFALDFNQISLIAPFANLASVPLLGVLLGLSILICLGSLIMPPLAPILGWLVWPLLWYITTVISWCAHLPGAYLQVNTLSPLVAWIYYALLAWLTVLFVTRWRQSKHKQSKHAPMLSRRAKLAIQGGLALLILFSTGILAQAAPSNQHLAIAVLSTGDPAQGQALLLSTPGGQTALIDEGANSVVLTQTLDTHLPF